MAEILLNIENICLSLETSNILELDHSLLHNSNSPTTFFQIKIDSSPDNKNKKTLSITGNMLSANKYKICTQGPIFNKYICVINVIPD